MKLSPRLVVLWFVCIAMIWIVRGLPWNLDEFDQAKQAYTSYEMIGRGEWWFQHTPRQDSATKPPLVGWLSAGIQQVTGSWDVAWRLPSLLAALAILTLLWRSGCEIGGHPAAYLATAAFAWNLLTLRIATMVRTDMVLAALIFSAGWMIWRRLQLGELWTSRDTVLLAVLLTFATMTKGPIYHAFLLPGLIAWIAFSDGNQNRWKIAIGYGLASVISLVPFLIWTTSRMQHDPAFYNDVVVKEFLGRFTTGAKAVHNNQTWYFYLPHLLTKMLPWSLLLVAGLALSETRTLLKKNPALLWLVCWLVGGIIAMSVVPSKRVDRIFPVIPVAALTLASMLPALLQRKWMSPRVLTSLSVLAVVGYTGYTGFIVIDGYRKGLDRLPRFGASVQSLCRENRWEYAIVEGRDEGLLMYAGKFVFTDFKTAAAQLKNRTLEAVVVDPKNLARMRERFGPLQILLQVDHPTDTDYSYYLVKPTGA